MVEINADVKGFMLVCASRATGVGVVLVFTVPDQSS
jgi:hypothetical protein